MRQTGAIQVSAGGRIAAPNVAFGDSFEFDELGVPGLGFDYPHLAAISGGLRNQSSGQFGRHHHFGDFAGGSFVPIWFGGYPYYYDETAYEQPAPQAQVQPQPQIIVLQQPVPIPAAESVNASGNAATQAAPEPQTPVRDVGEFILVRRDGRVLFASMYSVVGSQLRYISPEGIRYTLPLTDLDGDATREMNEARGTTVEIHN
jgi:hypothetical protein